MNSLEKQILVICLGEESLADFKVLAGLPGSDLGHMLPCSLSLGCSPETQCIAHSFKTVQVFYRIPTSVDISP